MIRHPNFMATIALGIAGIGVQPAAQALDSFGYGDVSNLDQSSVGALIQTMVVGGASFRDFAPASPIQSKGQAEIGIDWTVFSTSQDFALAMHRAGITSSIPENIAMPHLVFRKSLPGAFGFALSLGSYGSNHSFGFQGEYRWQGQETQDWLAVTRASYSMASLFFIDAHLLKVEQVFSHQVIGIFEPFMGVAVGVGGGELQVPLTGAAGLPTSIDPTSKEFMATFEAGFSLQVSQAKFSFLYETGWDQVRTFGTKLSYAF